MDWAALARELGCLEGDSSEACDVVRASRALDLLIGDETIRAAVDLVVDNGPGRLLAQYALVQMMSRQASVLAYDIYRTDRQRAVWAAQLIMHIGHPDTAQYLPIFLADDDGGIALTGMDLLDRLLGGWAQAWLDDAFVEQVLARASEHPCVACACAPPPAACYCATISRRATETGSTWPW